MQIIVDTKNFHTGLIHIITLNSSEHIFIIEKNIDINYAPPQKSSYFCSRLPYNRETFKTPFISSYEQK